MDLFITIDQKQSRVDIKTNNLVGGGGNFENFSMFKINSLTWRCKEEFWTNIDWCLINSC